MKVITHITVIDVPEDSVYIHEMKSDEYRKMIPFSDHHRGAQVYRENIIGRTYSNGIRIPAVGPVPESLKLDKGDLTNLEIEGTNLTWDTVIGMTQKVSDLLGIPIADYEQTKGHNKFLMKINKTLADSNVKHKVSLNLVRHADWWDRLAYLFTGVHPALNRPKRLL